MSQQAYSQPQVKELFDDAKVNEGEIKWLTSDEEEEIHNDDDDRSIDIKETNEDEKTESDNDEYVVDDADEEMKVGENVKTGKDDEEMTDAEKADAEKTEEAKGIHEQVGNELAKCDQAKEVNAQDNQAASLASVTQKEMPEIPPTSSSLSVSSGLSPTLLYVPVSVIPEQTILSTAPPHAPIATTFTSMLQQTTPIPIPPIIIEPPPVTTVILDLVLAIVQRLSDIENQFEA
nr:hypothetical protein [Tanacetum cinerariifolium]